MHACACGWVGGWVGGGVGHVHEHAFLGLLNT